MIGAEGVPTSSEETLVIGASAIGITADLCGPGNDRGALCQVLDESIYMSLHGSSATPDSGDFLLPAGTFVYVCPARMARFIRVSSSARLKVQSIQ